MSAGAPGGAGCCGGIVGSASSSSSSISVIRGEPESSCWKVDDVAGLEGGGSA